MMAFFLVVDDWAQTQAGWGLPGGYPLVVIDHVLGQSRVLALAQEVGPVMAVAR